MHLRGILAVLFAGSVHAASTDYFPPPVEGVTVLHSKHETGVSLSYKKIEVCECSYAGYVHLPATALADVEGPPEYPMNIFYWFFPARESPETAPLSIWIGGGPGEAAISGAMLENGPCSVTGDGNGTILNAYSRNNKVNMLYIDQPVGAGFSYSTLQNVTYSQLDGSLVPTDFSHGIPYKPNITVFPGTVTNQDTTFQPNNSNIAAKAMWHFAQVWLDEFPVYHPHDSKISLWTNSYGGYYGPAAFEWFQEQNNKIAEGNLKAHYLHLDTLGIENGCIDGISQVHSWPDYAYNNTYNLQMINKTVYDSFNSRIDAPDTGCVALIEKCRALGEAGDPEFYATNTTVNNFCSQIALDCFDILTITSDFANRNVFDIAQIGPRRFPATQHIGFFNQRWVQAALGVPVNFTDSSSTEPIQYFVQTSDPFRQNQSSVEHMLAQGVQVALVYGDRDSRCNWIGAENVSLTVNYGDAAHFRGAGYAEIKTKDSSAGGLVRQYDGFSFSRVFEAGHAVSAFQPQTASAIFERVMFRKDVATGKVAAGSHNKAWAGAWHSRIARFIHGGWNAGGTAKHHYQSKGPKSSWGVKNKLPADYPLACNIWAASFTCSESQLSALADGTAVVKDNLVVTPAA